MRIKTTSLIALAVFPREEIVDKKSLFVSETTFVIKWLLPIEFSIMCLLQDVNSSIFGR